MSETKPATFTNADFPTDAEGKSYHLEVKRGDIANRILTCGDVSRVQFLSKFLDKIIFSHLSARGFLTVTGLVSGVPVTIQSSLMGFPNLDFAVRESLAMVDGTVVCVRFGTCGTPSLNCKIGDLALATECRGIYRNPDAFRKRPEGAPEPTVEERYHITQPVPADPELFKHLKTTLTAEFPDVIKEGTNMSGCTFYASQGRPGNIFEDHNEDLLAHIQALPNAVCIEMETFHLFDLADISKGKLRAAGSALIIADRQSKAFVTPEQKEKWVAEYGRALLHALASFPIPESELMHDKCAVWLQ